MARTGLFRLAAGDRRAKSWSISNFQFPAVESLNATGRKILEINVVVVQSKVQRHKGRKLDFPNFMAWVVCPNLPRNTGNLELLANQ